MDVFSSQTKEVKSKGVSLDPFDYKMIKHTSQNFE